MSAAVPLPAALPRYHTLDACFLGTYGENDALLEKLMVVFLRDHVYLAGLGLDVGTLERDGDDDRLLILRHTLMNPYLIDHENGISYIDRYFEFLDRRVRALTATTGHATA